MIAAVIQQINDSIVGNMPLDWRIDAHAMAIPVVVRSDDDEESHFPAIIERQTGECHYVFVDDDYDIGFYHRLLQKSYSTMKGFGNCDKDVEISDIIVVCWGFIKTTGKSADEIEQILIKSMPREAKLISSNFDAYGVFNSEFKKVDYFLSAEQFLFSLRYRVQYPFLRGCIAEIQS